ncbi:O-methyltransferase [Pseudopedobacter saltans DSM 12145]|uniref:O-methyltransferase n=1 Tax=Pseudopedobacter saltans (strain ATCC 51119 / DSM 12145 / JCM 21818 / CCUG 39354 / LMG 10337 / NBRC 100064 / NCIMB 13643) TaxID=762903 RepID=F0S669_PSESL|nr:class I SAM-dependent methyltransferase [Pseudopedobacter saltans]ADY53183.1 O-methyltransferase [Pseudopedobacter saltans DSM 12145]
MVKFQFIKDFITHRLTSKTRHGIHSPFVYKMIDEVIYDLKTKDEYKNIEDLRKKLISDNRIITITDLGAGSHMNNNKQKAVAQIAKNALKPQKLAQLIYRLAKEMQPSNIIELGTCLGVTTSYLAKAAPHATIITMEGCPETAKVARENFQDLGLSNIQLEIGNFDDNFPNVIDRFQKLDFVFIDGNHRKDATLDYFKWSLPKVHENSLLIFDDIYWSKGMKEAWEEVKNHPDVSFTIDLFWIGLVFFRKGQAKEHFKVKF